MLSAADPEQLARFYQDGLGLRFFYLQDRGAWQCELGEVLVVIEPSGGPGDGAPSRPGGPCCILRVADLNVCLDRLRVLGVEPVAPPDAGGDWITASIRDPEGNTVRLAQYQPVEARYADRCLKRRAERQLCADTIRRLDEQPISDDRAEIRLFAIVRNETLRLPYFLEHYRALGVDRMFFLDNMSTDGTVDLLRAQERVHVYQTDAHFSREIGLREALLWRHGLGHWCVLVDADELLVYPHCESLGLARLCDVLAAGGHDAMQSFLLDLYPRGPLQTTGYVPGTDPRRVARWFDADSHFVKAWETHIYFNHRSPAHRFLGGVRNRVFGVNPCLDKFPLVRFHDRMLLHLGLHEVEGARVSDIRSASLHCKFLQDFAGNAVAEAAREQHWNAAYEYKRYAARVRENAELSLWTQGSVELGDSAQLVRLGFMASSPELDAAAGRTP